MRRILGALCVVALAATAAMAQETTAKPMSNKGATKSAAKTDTAASPYNGTWKLNAGKSHFSNPSMGLKALTVNVDSTPSKFAWTATGEDSGGHAMDLAYHGAIDGKSHPIAGDPNAATIAYKSGPNNALDATWKDAKGNVYGTQHLSLSPDKKTITVTGQFKDPSGKTSNSTEVYEQEGGATNAAKKMPAKK